VVNESLARRLFDGQEAVGRQLYVFDEPRVIVGVVGDVVLDRGTGPTPCIYLPHAQSPRLAVAFVARAPASGPASSLLAGMPAAVQAVDRDQPVTSLMSFQEHVELEFAGRRLTNGLLVVFCALALVIAAIGLYGVISYVVSQRKREVAIRMAIGAAPERIFRLILIEGLAVMGAGVAVALVLLVASRQALDEYMGGLVHAEWTTTAGVVFVIVLVGALSSMLPALRAARTPPNAALREA
jgi:hypothetical protein